MKVSVSKDYVKLLEKTSVQSGEYNVNEIEFEFDEIYTNDLVKMAVFSCYTGNYQTTIIDNKCQIPHEVLESEEEIVFGVYAYVTKDDELILRYSPKPIQICVNEGSYKDGLETEEITPTQFELYMSALQAGLNQVENVDIDVIKENKVATVTITNRNAETKTVNIYDGEKGDSGIVVFSMENGHLIATSEGAENLTHYSLENNHLYLEI